MPGAIQDFVFPSVVKPLPEPPIAARQCEPSLIYIPGGRPIRPLPSTPRLEMHIGVVALVTDTPSPSKRSPTQRHMHNYSLPSPLSLTTSPRPTRCQSSPSFSDFRQAVYIPETVPESPSRERVEAGTSNAEQQPPLLASTDDEDQPTPVSPSPSSHSSRRTSLPGRKSQRLSALSLASLPFPLPSPLGGPSECEWDMDPFADASGLRSKWSPTSSTMSIAQQFEIKKDKTPSGRLRDFLRQSVSAFHIRASIAGVKHTDPDMETQEQQSFKTPRNSVGTEKEVPVAELSELTEEHPSTVSLLASTSSDAEIVANPELHPHPPSAEGRLGSLPEVERLDADVECNDIGHAGRSVAVVSGMAPITTNADLDAEDPLLHPPHASPPRLAPSLMLPTVSPSPPLLESPRSPIRILPIPPPPLGRPPNPLVARSKPVLDFGFPSPPSLTVPLGGQAGPSSPVSPSGRRLPPLPTQPSPPSPLVAPSDVRINGTPAVPPRSKLRPLPVKIGNTFSQASKQILPLVERRSLPSPLEFTPQHSHSSSGGSISPMPTPPRSDSPLPSSPTHRVSSSDVVATLLLQRSGGASGDEKENVQEVFSIRDSSIPEFSWTGLLPDLDDDTVSIYSQSSAAYTFRSRSVRRQTRRSSRRKTAMSMMSVYSQASFFPRDVMDMPPISSLPWTLKETEFADDLGSADSRKVTFDSPTLPGVALENAEPAVPPPIRVSLAPRKSILKTTLPNPDSGPLIDWENLFVAQLDASSHRRTSSNISLVESSLPTIEEGTFSVQSQDQDLATPPASISGDSIGIPPSPSCARFIPNRRRRTVRVSGHLPRAIHHLPPPPSATSVNFADGSSWPSEMPPASPGFIPKKANNGSMRSSLRGLRKRIVSFTFSRPSSILSADFFDRHSGTPRSSVSPSFTSPGSSVSSSSSSSRGASPRTTGSWTGGDVLVISSTAI